MKEISTNISINASVEKVWEVLSNFESYPEWNPFITSIKGKAEAGGRLVVRIKPPNASAMTFKPKVLTCESGKELRWLGKLLITGLFDGEHYFQLTSSNGITTFVQGEKFTGILVGLFSKTFDKTRNGFMQMNEALKKECERQPG